MAGRCGGGAGRDTGAAGRAIAGGGAGRAIAGGGAGRAMAAGGGAAGRAMAGGAAGLAAGPAGPGPFRSCADELPLAAITEIPTQNVTKQMPRERMIAAPRSIWSPTTSNAQAQKLFGLGCDLRTSRLCDAGDGRIGAFDRAASVIMTCVAISRRQLCGQRHQSDREANSDFVRYVGFQD
jgi:hypothetical protein